MFRACSPSACFKSACLYRPELPDDQFLQPEEIFPGATLELLGRSVHVLSCADDQTRGWLLLAGLPAETVGGLVEDPHTTHLRSAAESAKAAERATHATTADNDEMRRRERNGFIAKPALRFDKPISGKATTPLSDEQERLQCAMLWGGRSVHFCAVFRGGGDKEYTPHLDRRFTLTYFFADGTVQLVELLPRNSGDGFASMRLQPHLSNAWQLLTSAHTTRTVVKMRIDVLLHSFSAWT